MLALRAVSCCAVWIAIAGEEICGTPEATQVPSLLQIVAKTRVSTHQSAVDSGATFEASRASSCCPQQPSTHLTWSAFNAEFEVQSNISVGLPVVVPCGHEVTMDEGVTGLGGLHVHGSLKFQDGVDISVETDHILVCGQFTLGSSTTPHLSKVEIVLTGSTDVEWGDKNFGKAPFVAYGGTLSIRGAACGTTTWTRLQQTITPASDASNIALEQPAKQSSDGHRNWGAHKGVDGSTSWKKGTSITSEEMNPWWYVEVESSTGIGQVLLTRRSHGTSSDLSQARVGVTSSLCEVGELCSGVVCAWVATYGEKDEFDCGGAQGAMVYVQMQGETVLTLAEVEVFPHLAPVEYVVELDEKASVSWKVGDVLMLAASGFSADETEEVTVVRRQSNHSFVVEGLVKHEHLGCVTSQPECIMASEVAALSRNIIIRGREGCDPTCGHFMIAHTNNGFVCGVEFTNLGQEATEGRYPVHVHMPGESPDLVIKDNAIHHNIQRGAVMHGVHNMTLESNICYTTKGHCFMGEDGVEQHNHVLRNLAAVVKALDFGCKHTHDNNFTCADRSDMVPNGFWIPNPNNYFDGNVGVVDGEAFRFETRHVTGLTRRKYPAEAEKVGKIKGRVPLLQFTNNGAHSSHGGVGNYPKFGASVPQADYVNFTAWRCYRGMSIHTGANPPRIVGATLVENTVAIRGALPNAHMEVLQTKMIARPGWSYKHGKVTYRSTPFIINKLGKTEGKAILDVFHVDNYTLNWARCHGHFDAEGLDFGGKRGNWFELFTASSTITSCPPA